MFMILRRT